MCDSPVLALPVSKGNGQNYSAKPDCKASSVHRYPLLCHKKMVSHLHSPLPNISRLGPVVQKMDSTIQRINLYPLDNATASPNTFPLDSAIQRLNNGSLKYISMPQCGLSEEASFMCTIRLIRWVVLYSPTIPSQGGSS